MDWHGKEVLVTGAGGFIGSYLTERLLREGAHVRALVFSDREGRMGHLTAGLDEGHPGKLLPCFGNIRDAAFIASVTRGVDTVFHLAASTSVVYSYWNPDDTIMTNVTGTLNVCTAARHEGCRRVVHTSSAGVYGTATGEEEISERHPLVAHNPYTASKLAADSVVESFHRSYDLPVATVRMFNVYGPRVSQFLVIPTIIMQLMETDTVKLGDITPTRNFTYVDDMVEAFIRTAEVDGVEGEVVNFGSQEAVTIGQLAEKIAAIMGKPLQIEHEVERLRPARSEIQRVVADISKARKLLGWEPKISLDEGLRRTIAWFQEGHHLHSRR